MFRYFAWKEGGFWQGQSLLSEVQIRSLLKQFNYKYETFASIQLYDDSANVVSCPLYMDFDGTGALEDTRYAFHIIKELLWVEPKVWFSGNKGYHLILPVEIKHPRCHDIVKVIVNRISKTWTALDNNVYRTRSMFRVPNSPASKPGYFKTRLSPEELLGLDMEVHREYASKQNLQPVHDPVMNGLNKKEWDLWVSDAISALPEKAPPSDSSQTVLNARAWTDCLQVLMETPPTGSRHNVAFLLSRWFIQAGYSEADTLGAFYKFKHWSDFEEEERGITRVVKSLVRSGMTPKLGCKYEGIDREIMKPHCNSLCEYNTDWSPV